MVVPCERHFEVFEELDIETCRGVFRERVHSGVDVFRLLEEPTTLCRLTNEVVVCKAKSEGKARSHHALHRVTLSARSLDIGEEAGQVQRRSAGVSERDVAQEGEQGDTRINVWIDALHTHLTSFVGSVDIDPNRDEVGACDSDAVGIDHGILNGVVTSERVLGGYLGLSTAQLVVDGNRRVGT